MSTTDPFAAPAAAPKADDAPPTTEAPGSPPAAPKTDEDPTTGDDEAPSAPEYDPGAKNADEVIEDLAGMTVEQVESVLELERAGKDRKTVVEAAERERERERDAS